MADLAGDLECAACGSEGVDAEPKLACTWNSQLQHERLSLTRAQKNVPVVRNRTVTNALGEIFRGIPLSQGTPFFFDSPVLRTQSSRAFAFIPWPLSVMVISSRDLSMTTEISTRRGYLLCCNYCEVDFIRNKWNAVRFLKQ
jgi:hypothetical protein